MHAMAPVSVNKASFLLRIYSGYDAGKKKNLDLENTVVKISGAETPGLKAELC